MTPQDQGSTRAMLLYNPGEIDWPAIEEGPVVVHPLRLKRTDVPISQFGEDIWSLRPMDVSLGCSQNLHWQPKLKSRELLIPTHLIPSFKRIMWLMINAPTPPASLASARARTWPAAASLVGRFSGLRRFAMFLGENQVGSLSEVNAELLEEYATFINQSETLKSPEVKLKELGLLALIANLGEMLPEDDRMILPPWGSENLSDRVGRAGDNNKAMIHPDTFAPLLWWAQQMMVCAPDVIDAVEWLHRSRCRPGPKERTAEGLKAVERIVAERNGVLPQKNVAGHVAAEYLVAVHGGQVHHSDFGSWRRLRGGGFELDPLLEQPIPIPVTCRIESSPWLTHIDFRHIPMLHRVLQAAAAVMICACTGMRGEECLKLPRGALRTIPRPDGAHSYRVDGRIYKAVSDDEDQQDRAGKAWVWATIKPAADAIQILERLADATGSMKMFSHLDLHCPQELTSEGMTRWIQEFIEFANDRCVALGLDIRRRIDADPAGYVTLERFRRSVAWHIVNRPEGQLAAGVQFGHMQSTTTDGYASTMKSGIAATMDVERTRALYTTLQAHAMAAKKGMRVSGPAAKRLGKMLNRFEAKQFPGTYASLSRSEERRLRGDPDLAVRENPGHGCLCLANPLKPETMACSKESDGEPNRNDCKTYCGNRVYTDVTVHRDRQEIIDLRERIEHATPLLAARIARRVDHLEAHVAQHDSTSLPLLNLIDERPDPSRGNSSNDLGSSGPEDDE